MYKELMDALKAKFQGVSDNILSRIATKLAKTATTSEQVQAAVDGVTLQQVIDGYADYRATEATQTAVHNYEQKYGLKDGKKTEPNDGGGNPPTPPTPPAGGSDAVPEWARKMQEDNKALLDRLAKMETERTTSTRKAQLDEVVGKLPENIRKAYGRTPLDGLTDEQFTTLLSEVRTEVEGITQATQQRGAVFGRPNTANGGSATGGELSKEQLEAIAHRDGTASGESQPF